MNKYIIFLVTAISMCIILWVEVNFEVALKITLLYFVVYVILVLFSKYIEKDTEKNVASVTTASTPKKKETI